MYVVVYLLFKIRNAIMVKVIKCVRRSNDRPHNPSRLFADSTGVPPPPLEGTTSCLPAAWFVKVNSFCLWSSIPLSCGDANFNL